MAPIPIKLVIDILRRQLQLSCRQRQIYNNFYEKSVTVREFGKCKYVEYLTLLGTSQ